MKSIFKIIGVIALFYGAFLTIGFTEKDENPAPSVTLQKRFKSQVEATSLVFQELEKAAHQTVSNQDVAALRTALVNARNAYKSVELFIAYFDPEGTKDRLNGAPLLTVERKVADLNVLDPEGLQILDELIFSDNEQVIAEIENIQQLTKNLNKEFNSISTAVLMVPFESHHVFEAIRQDLIRVFTLSVTGFDTPLSGNALPETVQSLKSMQAAYNLYSDLVKEKDPKMAKSISDRWHNSIHYVEKNNDFDSFDRLHFLTEYINPLFAQLLDAHLLLEIETPEEIYQVVRSTNYRATNLFSTELFNPYYYLKLEPRFDSEKAVELGKLLFFDPILSANNKRSCASCHHPDKAFTDGVAKSIAMDFEGTVDRNAPTLINAIYADRFFHDLRAHQLEAQTEHVIRNPKEFATDYAEILEKLRKSEEYQQLFKDAFPAFSHQPVAKPTLSLAMAAYIKSLTGFNSPFDQYVRGESADLSEAAKRGFNLFMGKAACGTCHFAPTFNGTVPPLYQESESEVLGVPATKDTLNPTIDADRGRIANGIIREEAYFYAHSFKTPTVRNIELTAPYMHNGVYDSLEEVMDFYNKGGGVGLGLTVEHQTLPFDSLSLNQQEISDIIVFMEALTDTTGLTSVPKHLPSFEQNSAWNNRKIGGEY